MNEKTAKKIRRTLMGMGLVKAPLNMIYREEIPLTFIYPKGSFQRMYRNIKNHNPEFHFPK